MSPGGVATEIVQSNEFILDPKRTEDFKNFPFLQSEDVADSVLYVLSTAPHVQVDFGDNVLVLNLGLIFSGA